MDFKVRVSSLCRVPIGISLVSLAFGLAASSASAQQPDAAAAKAAKVAEHSKLVDRILADDAKLGSDDWRILKLSQSTRRHEVAKMPSGNRTLQAFVAYPDKKDAVPVLLMLPEDQGLNNWARIMADEIAGMGYIVVVPDLLAGFGPDGGGHDSFPDKKSVLMAVDELLFDNIMADLNAWADFGKTLPQANGKLAVIGFGWGAGKTFWFATQRKDLSATFIFYDWAPPADALAGITAPVYGFYAERDPRVTKSLPATKEAMARLGKKFETIMYPNSEHMFVRVGEMPADQNPANFQARCLSLARLQDLLKEMDNASPVVQTAKPAQQPARQVLTLTSTAFEDGGIIPNKYTGAANPPGIPPWLTPQVSPPLAWSTPPEGTVSFVLTMHDPDETVSRGAKQVLHWLMFNIPATVHELPEAVPLEAQRQDGSIQIQNVIKKPGYLGPGASSDGPYHHYTITVFALDTKLALAANATEADVDSAMQGHILAKGVLVGRFRRP